MARPYHERRAAEIPRPKSCDEKLWTTQTIPIGKMKIANAFVAPVVVAASAASPRCATMTASAIPTTTCDAREITMGQASASSA